jgi:O-antigen/teichoic acid export membrane protein
LTFEVKDFINSKFAGFSYKTKAETLKYIYYLVEKATKYKTLVQNFSYITLFQVFNLLVPIITYPFLIRILGKDTYGLVVFAQAIIGYLVLLVSYGFNISATREISINRDNPIKLNEIVSSVLIIKAGLLIISCLILTLMIWIIPQFQDHKALFYLSLWMCFYEMLFPSWYFQGIEQMKFITYINLINRSIFIVLMFIFIQSPEDYLFLPITSGLGAILASIFSLYIVFKKHRIQFVLQPFSRLRYYLNNSRPIFISYLSSKIYYGSNRVIIGSFLGMSEVAYYDLGEKITQVLKIPQSILSQILFPKISLEKDINFIKKVFKVSLTFHLIIFSLTILFSKGLVNILGGSQMEPAYLVLDLLALTIPIVAISNIFGTQILIPFGHSKSFRNVVVSSAILYILLFLILWSFAEVTVISISVLTVIVEVYIMTMFLVKCKKYYLWNY